MIPEQRNLMLTATYKSIFCWRDISECGIQNITKSIRQAWQGVLAFLSFILHSKSSGLAFFIEKNHICQSFSHPSVSLSTKSYNKQCYPLVFSCREGFSLILMNNTNPSQKFPKTANHLLILSSLLAKLVELCSRMEQFFVLEQKYWNPNIFNPTTEFTDVVVHRISLAVHH